MEAIRKHLLDRFQEHLQQDFEHYCSRHQLEKTEELFISFLYDNNLLSPVQIQRYTIQHEYGRASMRHPHKTETVQFLSERFGISARTIWNALKRTKS